MASRRVSVKVSLRDRIILFSRTNGHKEISPLCRVRRLKRFTLRIDAADVIFVIRVAILRFNHHVAQSNRLSRQ